jgi:cobalt-zinc-cadmium efflux system protein
MGAEHNHGDMKGKKLGFSILLNLLITVAQGIGALVSGSLSLLSDALHNFSDVIALIISYIADKLTQKKYSKEKTFGFKRAEVIAALINATTLIVIALMITKEAFSRFNQPVEVDSFLVIVLAGLSILVNAGSALLIKGEVKDNMNMRSAYLHLLSDLFSSVAVLIGGVVMHYYQVYWLDSVLSLAIAAYLIYASSGLLIKTLKVLMQFSPSHIKLKDVESRVLQLAEVEQIHHLHIWQLNDKDIHFEAHVNFQDNIKLSEVSEVLNTIRVLLRHEFNINHSTLQPGYGIEGNKDMIVDER